MAYNLSKLVKADQSITKRSGAKMIVFTVQSMMAIAIGIIIGKIVVYCAKKWSGS